MLRNPGKFAFIQVVRLLHMWTGESRYLEWREILRTRLRFRSTLSLSFAVTDVDDLELELSSDPQDTCPFASARVTASFLGLYGSTSPLPTFYTERLLEEQAEDCSVTRDFLDVFNNVFFHVYVRLAALMSPLYNAFGAGNPVSLHMLMSLAGFGNTSLRARLQDEQVFLRYAGLFSQSVRSASGLGAVLADAAGGIAVRIRCNEERLATVPEEQRLRLGESSCLLGEDALLGFAVPCLEGKIIIEFAGLDAQTLHSLVPGARLSGLLHGLVVNYCREPLQYEAELRMASGAALPARLGGDAAGAWAALGHDVWTGWGGEEAGQALPRASALFTAGFAPA
ncbi:MAG: type VI secretion system baseplate subunit TssG [Desulfovibrio sp.]|jgi:type VI secretion system protein ImpH|nr:type VI secretion system baseplate subunit TssG [Desulfovibrio sp.]